MAGLLIAFDLLVNGAVNKAVDGLSAGFCMGLDDLFFALGQSYIDSVIVRLDIFVDCPLLRFRYFSLLFHLFTARKG